MDKLDKQRMLRHKAYNIAVERNKKEKNEEVNLLLNQFYAIYSQR